MNAEDLSDLRCLLLNRVSLIENFDKAVDVHVLSTECRVLRFSREERFDELCTCKSIYRKDMV
jgi:hypothetical protein